MATNKPKTGTSTNTYGKIDTSEVSKALWLARFPPKLAQVFDEAPEGTLLGHLVFTKGTPKVQPDKQTTLSNESLKREGNTAATSTTNTNTTTIPQKLSIAVSEELTNGAKDIPLDYTLTNLTTKIPSLYPFSRNEDGSVHIHGTIARSCNLQMERSERYREMCKNRLLKAVAGKDKRHVMPMNNAELSLKSAQLGNLEAGFGSSIASFGQKLLSAQRDAQNQVLAQSRKRKFDDTQSLRSILFELFDQQNVWTMKELREPSGRPEKEIRVELTQIAEYQRAGEFKGTWQLKKEFAGATSNATNHNPDESGEPSSS
jgi:hypothetical protein